MVPAVLLVSMSMVPAASGGGSSSAPVTTDFPGATSPSGEWPYPNGDLANIREAPGSAISSANVSSLREAWVFKLAGKAAAGTPPYGSLTAAPVVQDGVVYLQDQDANVYALALATGKLLWEHQVNQKETSGPGPDGVAVGGGRVYGDTPSSAFALSAATGKTIWVDSDLLTKAKGRSRFSRRWPRGGSIWPARTGSARGGGVLMALDAANGHLLWVFNTVVQSSPGVQALGVGSGGAWETPLVGSDGSVTFGIGNPYQTIASALKYPLRQLYTDSEVNLDAATGKLRWYYQAVPDDFMDNDLQASPVSASVRGARVIIATGKVGYVYALDARSGALIWKTPVGGHKGHDTLPAGAVAQAEDQAPLHRRARAARRGAVEPGRGGRQRVRGHQRPPGHRHQPENLQLQEAATPDGGDGGAQPRHRQGRMGHQGRHDAAGRGHGLQ